METKSLAEVLKAAVLAGLIAGAVSAGFHWVFTEPLIDRAVEMEEHLRESPGVMEPVVSRPIQKLGLFFGFLVYGGAWGLLCGLLVHAIRPWFDDMSYGKQGFYLVALLGWAVAIFPSLKYPANPPGVGEAETIGYRQELFLGAIMLSLIGALVALGIERWLRHIGRRASGVVLVSYLICLVLIFLALPSNPDPVRLPTGLVHSFRALSLLGQILFWVVLGALFAWMCRAKTRST